MFQTLNIWHPWHLKFITYHISLPTLPIFPTFTNCLYCPNCLHLQMFTNIYKLLMLPIFLILSILHIMLILHRLAQDGHNIHTRWTQNWPMLQVKQAEMFTKCLHMFTYLVWPPIAYLLMMFQDVSSRNSFWI